MVYVLTIILARHRYKYKFLLEASWQYMASTERFKVSGITKKFETGVPKKARRLNKRRLVQKLHFYYDRLSDKQNRERLLTVKSGARKLGASCARNPELLEARRKLFDTLTVPCTEMPRVTVKLCTMWAFALAVGSLRANLLLPASSKCTLVRWRTCSSSVTTFAVVKLLLRFFPS